MADVAQNYGERQEFWKPITVEQHQAVASDVCEACGTDYPLGARFCYVCGAERNAHAGAGRGFSRYVDIAVIKNALGLTTGSLIGFIAGIVCIIAGCIMPFVYTVSTFMDWQGVHVYRIEWLLAAIAAFAVGNLFKR
jgi:hypothetical protein